MPEKHSMIGASSCYRWWQCPGSVGLIRKAPQQEPSSYALEGTTAHELAERSLKSGFKPDHFVGRIATATGLEFTDEMAEHVQTLIDFIDSLLEKFKLDRQNIQIEQPFDLGWLYEGLYGTNDINIVDRRRKYLYVIDFKYGSGVPVEVYENKQLMYYGLGAMYELDFSPRNIVLIIVQPRAIHPQGPIRKWEISKKLLNQFALQLVEAAEKTKKRPTPRFAGEWCKFCPALSICPEARIEVTRSAVQDFSPVPVAPLDVEQKFQLPDPALLTPEQLGNVLNASSFINDWVKAVNGYAQQRAESGDEIPGYKLVKKRANRKWKDEATLINELEMEYSSEEIFVKKLKSPAQMEKVIPKERVEENCVRPDTGNVLVPETDRREAVKPAAVEDFSGV